MKRIVSAGALVLAACFAPPSSRAGSPPGPGFYLQGFAGYGSTSQGDLNHVIRDDEQYFRSIGIPVKFDTFGGSPDLGIEAGCRFSEKISAGLTFAYQRSTVRNAYVDASGSFADRYEAAITDLSGNVTSWLPAVPGWFLGAQAGVAFSSLKEAFAFQDAGNPTNDLDKAGEWTGSGLVLGAFAGYRHAFGDGPYLLGKVGYRYRNLGHFGGTTSSPQRGTANAGPQDSNGTLLDIDYSGAYIAVGLGVSVGRAR